MSQTGHDSHHHGFFDGFGISKSGCHHVVGFLLITWFEGWYHSKLRIEAAVLLVLAGMHRGIISCQYHQSTVYTSDSRVDKSISTYVHTYMFHADQCTLTRIRHSEGCFHRSFLVGTPTTMNTPCFGYRVVLDKLGDFCAWCSRVSIYAA